jgi:NAD(P)-dependent dehydrogenase (short-subunit alcohol dehydrogenase family)
MQIHGSVVLVTGGNRGIGAEFVRQLKQRGAAKIYVAARNIDSVKVDGVEVIALDVTDDAQVQAAAAQAGDVQVLINNAGATFNQTLLDGDLDTIRREVETNFFGPLKLIRAFAPVLAANGGGAVLNVLSAVSWISFPGATVYAASKAAAWSMTDGARIELAAQGTQVTGLHMGLVDTDMTAGFELEKIAPAVVVTAALDGIEAGATEVLADDTARQAKASLASDPMARYADVLATLV